MGVRVYVCILRVLTVTMFVSLSGLILHKESSFTENYIYIPTSINSNY